MLPIVFDSFYEYDEGVFLLTQSKLFKQMFENDLICQTELIYVTPEKKNAENISNVGNHSRGWRKCPLFNSL